MVGERGYRLSGGEKQRIAKAPGALVDPHLIVGQAHQLGAHILHFLEFPDRIGLQGFQDIIGIIGPNGAGKTTTMKMIACVSPMTGGELSVLGMDPLSDGPRIRARIGVVPQQDTLDMELTVRENLTIYGRYFGLSRAVIRGRVDELLDFVQLAERSGDQVEPLSGGMKRRLTIARSLVNEPDLLLLDEPTTGLDPQARHLLWDRLYRLKQKGVTLVLTTHYMDEAEQLCDRLVVMDKARIVAEGSPRDLITAMQTEMRKALNSDELRTAWNGLGAETPNLWGDDFGRFVGSEVKRWAEVVKASGAKLE
mgnify:CR=1 FL=1